jgi:predicted MFS family arabinose efflux permease
MTIENIGPLFSLYPIGGFIGTSIAGIVSERIRRRKPIVWTSGLFLPFLYTILVITDNEMALAGALFLAGFFAFMVIPIVMTIPFDMRLNPREIAVAMGLSRTFTPLAATAGPLLVGIIYQISGSLLLALCVVVPMPFLMALIGVLLPETSPNRTGISQ